MTLIFAFGLSFQMPVLLTLLGRVGIITSEAAAPGAALCHRGHRRRSPRVITPPDAFSMISLAVPLVILYEISIWLRVADRARPGEGRSEGGLSLRALVAAAHPDHAL